MTPPPPSRPQQQQSAKQIKAQIHHGRPHGMSVVVVTVIVAVLVTCAIDRTGRTSATRIDVCCMAMFWAGLEMTTGVKN